MLISTTRISHIWDTTIVDEPKNCLYSGIGIRAKVTIYNDLIGYRFSNGPKHYEFVIRATVDRLSPYNWTKILENVCL